MLNIQSKLFDEISVGDTASMQRTLQSRDIRAWASSFGDGGVLVEAGATQDTAGLVTSMLSALVGSAMPGPGSSILTTSVSIRAALPVNSLLTIRLVVQKKRVEDALITLAGECLDKQLQVVATAVLGVLAPATRQQRVVPQHRLDNLVTQCHGLKPMRTAVVYPCSVESLAGALEAAEAGLIVPVLFAPETQLHQIAAAAKLDLSKCRIVASDSPEDAAQKAALAAGNNEVQALMKGSLHTDILLHAAMQKEAKLRTGRLLSHCALVSVPTYARRVIITDAALNIAPDTDQKRDICQNAIGFAIALGIKLPKVAVLAAIELVNTRMPATLDGAILAKMADRRQIVGGIVDGPLDLDAAVDADAARIKHIVSPVAGSADVLLAPNIDAANMIYKDLGFMADAQSAGLVVGARVPIILTSRADSAATRLYSTAAAVLYADALARDAASILPEPEE
jgi:phosphotransacetylase